MHLGILHVIITRHEVSNEIITVGVKIVLEERLLFILNTTCLNDWHCINNYSSYHSPLNSKYIQITSFIILQQK